MATRRHLTILIFDATTRSHSVTCPTKIPATKSAILTLANEIISKSRERDASLLKIILPGGRFDGSGRLRSGRRRTRGGFRLEIRRADHETNGNFALLRMH